VKRLLAWVDTSDAWIAHWLRAAREALLGDMPVLAAGTALYAMFAVVPTIAAMVNILGLVIDPAKIEEQLAGLQTIIPGEVVEFIANQLERQAQRSNKEVGVALAISILAAVLSARGAARAMISSLNRAYRVRERRPVLRKMLLTLALAAGTLIGLVLMFTVVVALPAIFALFHLDAYLDSTWLRWPALMAVVSLTLAALYRFAPAPRSFGIKRHMWPGAGIATVLLVAVSYLLSIWVNRIAGYNVVYGAFGSVIVVMLWFYLSVIAIVLGGFVNAELERQRQRNTPLPFRAPTSDETQN
jgi:membrane protein